MYKTKKISPFLFCVILCIIFIQLKIVYATSEDIQPISYRAHVMIIGWQDPVKEKEMAGTTGISHRMEALQIYNNNDKFKRKYKANV